MTPKESINKELNELSPFLAKLKDKEEGYTVPQDYFSILPDEIMANCTPEKPVQAVEKNSIWRQTILFVEALLQPRLAMAFASIALLVVAVIFFIPMGNESIKVAEDLVTEEEAFAYVSENVEDFDLDFIAEELAGEIGFEEAFEINEETLNQYIEENILDDLDELTLEELL